MCQYRFIIVSICFVVLSVSGDTWRAGTLAAGPSIAIAAIVLLHSMATELIENPSKPEKNTNQKRITVFKFFNTMKGNSNTI